VFESLDAFAANQRKGESPSFLSSGESERSEWFLLSGRSYGCSHRNQSGNMLGNK